MRARILLELHHKGNRVIWAFERIRKCQDWLTVIFSDEERFNLDGPDGSISEDVEVLVTENKAQNCATIAEKLTKEGKPVDQSTVWSRVSQIGVVTPPWGREAFRVGS